ncbi:MAG: hypothetical protein JNL13_05285 [Chitinophagaceae bacterium]|nr:hypothetical protein [Chitinophagaceae bacterium]
MEQEQLYSFLQMINRDARIGPVHIALYIALLKCGHDQGTLTQIEISKSELMQTAKICSLTTFYKTLNLLIHRGYIKYYAALNRWETSKANLADFANK